ncbi:hypothetical protein FK514_29790, partial [Klebsiella pneumoniae]|nr:hypothetical protein [Klebsiella pneumoniae]
GSSAVSWFLEAIPPVITNGLIVASKILPALGFALLISMMLRVALSKPISAWLARSSRVAGRPWRVR